MALYFLIKYCEKAEHLLVKWCGFLWQFMLKPVILTELQKKGNKLSVVSSCLCAFPQTFKVKAVQITLTIYLYFILFISFILFYLYLSVLLQTFHSSQVLTKNIFYTIMF